MKKHPNELNTSTVAKAMVDRPTSAKASTFAEASANESADRHDGTTARDMVIAEIYAKLHLCLGNSALPRLAFKQRQLWRASAEVWKKQLYQLINESLMGRQITITQDEGRWLATHWDGNVARNVVLEAINYGDALELAYKEFSPADRTAGRKAVSMRAE